MHKRVSGKLPGGLPDVTGHCRRAWPKVGWGATGGIAGEYQWMDMINMHFINV